jgi:tRNA threonylcarbamoyladenosine biosynthesis protein TsaB
MPTDFLLAIDTCTRRSTIALRDRNALLAEHTWPCERQETAAVSARLSDMLQACGVKPAEIGAIAVGIGPGSFTGVRCGLAIAKGFAAAGSVRLIGVTAFDIIAHMQPRPLLGLTLHAVVEAGRGRVASCPYEWSDDSNGPGVAGEWRLQTHSEFAQTMQPPALVCGEVPPALMSALENRAVVAPAWLNLRRAGVLAELGYARWTRGEFDDPATLMPVYPPE